MHLLLATAREYSQHYPGERLDIGDLDAHGDRHNTHDRGVDVDLYLPGMMLADNAGGGSYPNNYRGREPLHVRSMQARVETLARILAQCSEGRLRIYYNDRAVVQRFNAWFEETGLRSPFGAPMQLHNDLHKFHFHVTVPADFETLPFTAPPGGDANRSQITSTLDSPSPPAHSSQSAG